MDLTSTIAAHIAGLPVEETLLYAAPVGGVWLAAMATQVRRWRHSLRRTTTASHPKEHTHGHR
ncbi:MAG: hypothetical protein JWQ20_1590 [Conexibacter sp.]|jgi:hypothetical protein|nr:hypothetical protein [Conexibacter sp.]